MPRNWFLLLHWQQTALNRPDVSYISRDLLFPSKSGKDDDMKTDCDRHSLATETLSTVSEGGRGGGGEGSVPGGTIVNCSRLKGHLSPALPPDGVTIATLLNWTKYTGALSEMKDINSDARRWSVQSYVFKRVHDWTDIFRIRPMMLWYNISDWFSVWRLIHSYSESYPCILAILYFLHFISKLITIRLQKGKFSPLPLHLRCTCLLPSFSFPNLRHTLFNDFSW